MSSFSDCRQFFSFRILQSADIPFLMRIETMVQTTPWQPENFSDCFMQNMLAWGIEINGSLVGFIIVLLDNLNEAHILNVAIDLNWQHQGLGRALLEAVLSHLKNCEITRVWLEVRCSNVQAISLYSRLGFVRVGERKNYYLTLTGREHAWVYLKEL